MPNVFFLILCEDCAEIRGAATPAGRLSGRNALSAWPGGSSDSGRDSTGPRKARQSDRILAKIALYLQRVCSKPIPALPRKPWRFTKRVGSNTPARDKIQIRQ